jgi:hypothetical protein
LPLRRARETASFNASADLTVNRSRFAMLLHSPIQQFAAIVMILAKRVPCQTATLAGFAYK